MEGGLDPMEMNLTGIPSTYSTNKHEGGALDPTGRNLRPTTCYNVAFSDKNVGCFQFSQVVLYRAVHAYYLIINNISML